MESEGIPRLADSPESVGIDSTKLEALFERAEREVQEGLLPSAQIAVARDGRIAAARTFGKVICDGREVPATDATLYCVFSCTKAITSAAAWLLLEEGKLSLEERVAEIIPEFGGNGKESVRVEQLFTHTAGFPTAPFPPAHFADRERRLEHFAQWRLNWEPGSRFEYHPSSSMYVLGDIIERRSGERFSDFIRHRIAKPLGLEDLWVGLPSSLHYRVAEVTHVGEELGEEDYGEMGLRKPPVGEVTEEALESFNREDVREAGAPGAGGTMTASTLALFYQGLLHGGASPEGPRVWQADTLRAARAIRSRDLCDPFFGKLANRALGLIVAGDAERNYRGFGHTNSPSSFGHGGAGGQVGWGDPETGISLAYCTSAQDRNAIRQARRVVGISSRAASLLSE